MDHWTLWALAGAIGIFAGFVKGATGFALPMILISGLGSFMAPETALAILIVPTVLSNVWQSLRGGIAGAKAALRLHWRYVAITSVFILLSAQLLAFLEPRAIFLTLGIPVLLFSLVQLFGWTPHVHGARQRPVEIAAATVSGVIGGLSGVWGRRRYCI